MCSSCCQYTKSDQCRNQLRRWTCRCHVSRYALDVGVALKDASDERMQEPVTEKANEKGTRKWSLGKGSSTGLLCTYISTTVICQRKWQHDAASMQWRGSKTQIQSYHDNRPLFVQSHFLVTYYIYFLVLKLNGMVW